LQVLDLQPVPAILDRNLMVDVIAEPLPASLGAEDTERMTSPIPLGGLPPEIVVAPAGSLGTLGEWGLNPNWRDGSAPPQDLRHHFLRAQFVV
jgi:hypothetical protein